MAIIITVTQLFLEFEASREDIKNEMKDVAKTFAPAIQSAVFDLDDELIATILTGINENPIIVGVDLKGDKGERLSQVGKETKRIVNLDFFEQQFSIRLDILHPDEKLLLGQVQLISDYSVIYNRLKVGILLIIINSVLKTAILWVIMIYFLRKYLASPIDQFTKELNGLDFGNLKPIGLSYPYKNELARMHSSFNALINGFISSKRELKKYHEELEEKVSSRTKDLEIAMNARSEFLSNMSHEIRTPLNAILGYAELLIDDNKETMSTASLKDMQKIQRAGTHLKEIIDDILNLSRLEAGLMELHREEFLLSSTLEIIEAIVSPLIMDTNIDFKIIVEEDVSFNTDQGKLKQILINLLSNSIKFTAQGMISLTVSVEGEDVKFIVKDSGIGMKQGDLDKIFKAFAQVHDTKSSVYEGTGLGLTISKKFCDLLGGTIDVESELGVGTTFKVVVPKKQSQKAPDAA